MFRDSRKRDNLIPFTNKAASATQNADQSTFYTCDFCDDVWASEFEVYCHKAVHIDEASKLIADNKTDICLTCITKYNSAEELIKHIKRRHLLSSEDAKRVEREIYICNSCMSIFFNKSMLIVHIMSYHSQITSKTPLPCPHCNKVIRRSAMYNHFRVYGIDICTCPICFEQSTEKHLEKHYPYLFCNICNIKMKPEKFHEHVAEHRNISGSYEKLGFEKYFIPIKQMRLLASHRLNPSRGFSLQNTLAICVLCREICENKKEMQQHLLSHTVTKPKPVQKLYTCFCGAEFSNKILLKQHLFKGQGSPQPHIEINDDLVVVFTIQEDCNTVEEDNTDYTGDHS